MRLELVEMQQPEAVMMYKAKPAQPSAREVEAEMQSQALYVGMMLVGALLLLAVAHSLWRRR